MGTESESGDDPPQLDMGQSRPDAGPYYVPVRRNAPTLALRWFRTPSGRRALAVFTSADRLTEILGADQSWVCLAAAVLPSLTTPLGRIELVVDPGLVAPAPAPLVPFAVRGPRAGARAPLPATLAG